MQGGDEEDDVDHLAEESIGALGVVLAKQFCVDRDESETECTTRKHGEDQLGDDVGGGEGIDGIEPVPN